jgi:hypothetical protein
MKITRRQLRKIIAEAAGEIDPKMESILDMLRQSNLGPEQEGEFLTMVRDQKMSPKDAEEAFKKILASYEEEADDYEMKPKDAEEADDYDSSYDDYYNSYDYDPSYDTDDYERSSMNDTLSSDVENFLNEHPGLSSFQPLVEMALRTGDPKNYDEQLMKIGSQIGQIAKNYDSMSEAIMNELNY